MQIQLLLKFHETMSSWMQAIKVREKINKNNKLWWKLYQSQKYGNKNNFLYIFKNLNLKKENKYIMGVERSSLLSSSHDDREVVAIFFKYTNLFCWFLTRMNSYTHLYNLLVCIYIHQHLCWNAIVLFFVASICAKSPTKLCLPLFQTKSWNIHWCR